jgi:hypothetical protein
MIDLRRTFAGNEWAGPVVLALTHLVVAALSFHQAPFTGGDDATYIALARSLIERHDYTDMWDPALPPHTQYPPIFPIVVAGGLLMGLEPLEGLKVLMMVITTATVFVSCVWLRRETTPGVAFCAGFFIAVSPEIIRLGQEVLSDIPFWLFAILALLAWRHAENKSPGEAMPVRLVVLAAAATLAAYFTRSAGAPLLVAVFIWLTIRKQYRAVGIVAAMSFPLIFLWWLRGHSVGAGGYLAPFIAIDPYNPALGTLTFETLVERLAKNASSYGSRHLSRLVFGDLRSGLGFGAAFAIAMVYGWIKRMKRPGLPEVWLPLYLALVLLWPAAWSGPRFLYPVVPVIALYVGVAIAELSRVSSHPRVFAAALLLAGLVTVYPGLRRQAKIGSACRERFASGEKFVCTEPTFAAFFEVADKSRGQLPEGSVVLSRKPTIFFAHSGYQSVLYPLFKVPDSLFALAGRTRAKYLVIDQISDLAPKYLHPVLAERHTDFCVVKSLLTDKAALARIEVRGPPYIPASLDKVTFRLCDGDTLTTR